MVAALDEPGVLEATMAAFRVLPLGLLMGLGLLSVGVGGLLAAQQRSQTILEGTSKGASLDRFLYDGAGETAFSFRVTDLRRGTLGPDVGVSLFPGALAAQMLVWA